MYDILPEWADSALHQIQSWNYPQPVYWPVRMGLRDRGAKNT